MGPLLWINPVDQTIATPWTEQRISSRPECFSTFCTPTTTAAHLTIELLDECRLDSLQGIITPTMDRLTDSQSQFLMASAEDAARRAAIAAHQTEERLLQIERLAAQLVRKNALSTVAIRIHEAIESRREARHRAWAMSELHAQVTQHFGGEIPAELRRGNTFGEAFDTDPVWWHCLLYGYLIKGRPAGTLVTYDDCQQILSQHNLISGNHTHLRYAIEEFVQCLADDGIVQDVRRIRDEPLRVHIVEDLDARRARQASLRTASSQSPLPGMGNDHRRHSAARTGTTRPALSKYDWLAESTQPAPASVTQQLPAGLHRAAAILSHIVTRIEGAGPVSDLAFPDIDDHGQLAAALKAGGLIETADHCGTLRWQRPRRLGKAR